MKNSYHIIFKGYMFGDYENKDIEQSIVLKADGEITPSILQNWTKEIESRFYETKILINGKYYEKCHHLDDIIIKSWQKLHAEKEETAKYEEGKTIKWLTTKPNLNFPHYIFVRLKMKDGSEEVLPGYYDPDTELFYPFINSDNYKIFADNNEYDTEHGEMLGSRIIAWRPFTREEDYIMHAWDFDNGYGFCDE